MCYVFLCIYVCMLKLGFVGVVADVGVVEVLKCVRNILKHVGK